jgi:hypothetical protein
VSQLKTTTLASCKDHDMQTSIELVKIAQTQTFCMCGHLTRHHVDAV